MPSPSVLAAFVDLVHAGQFVEAYERFYAPSATVRENLEPPRVGLETLIAHERGVLARFKAGRGRAEAVLAAHDQVAINWVFEFDMGAGIVMTLEEMALQTWSGEKIVAERFYYDPAQMRPRGLEA